MRAQWYGGPFDGSVIEVPDGNDFYAVAYDVNGQPLEGWPGLQGYAIDPATCDPMAHVLPVKLIVLYPVMDGGIWFSETGVVIVE